MRDAGILLFDGAMGTYYAQKYQDHTLCEFANLYHPGRILDIHKEYIEAGAQCIKTNTYRANTKSLKCGIEVLQKIIRNGYHIAKKAAGNDIRVFCDIGQIGDEHQNEYQTIIDIFLESGGKYFLMETFSEYDIVKDIASRIKEKQPEAYIIASFAVDADGYTNKGYSTSEIEHAVKDDSNIDCYGFNCVCGPLHLLKIAQRCDLQNHRISIMPNAGYPQVVDGRTVYMDNPNYFAQKLLEMKTAGVSILGGCCGTTPEHIRLSKELLFGESRLEVVQTAQAKEKQGEKIRNQFREKLLAGERVIAVELDSPGIPDMGNIGEDARLLKEAGADVITVADNPLARARADAMLISAKMKREAGIEVMPHMSCRDKNIIGIKAALIGGYIEQIRNLLIVTGDSVAKEEGGNIKGVFSMNSFQLLNYIRNLNHDLFASDPIFTGAALNVNADDFEVELRRAQRKIEAGAQFFLTQGIYDERSLANCALAKERLDTKILAGFMPLVGYKNAVFLNNEVPGVKIPANVIEKMEGLSREDGMKYGIELSLALIEQAEADGLFLMVPLHKTGMILEMLKELKV